MVLTGSCLCLFVCKELQEFFFFFLPLLVCVCVRACVRACV